ncbi:hypothetical protein SAMN05421780_101420 [Flexibacter flexilis DSM 6793]|uniref:Uncharacterized protein n=1 Tax=Flexibacter flexilis DSM 6793 TaxID=927664 RepID=A0A1I1DY10_9BACT|nr:hypothetical protein SAMN05421780_101420 [Flexibacter flexilis DSM 6793]
MSEITHIESFICTVTQIKDICKIPFDFGFCGRMVSNNYINLMRLYRYPSA